MCSHYQGIKGRERYLRHFGVEPPAQPGVVDLWPGYQGSFIRRRASAEPGEQALGPPEAVAGLFGLIPHWATDTKITRRTYNARSETVATKPSFKLAWLRAQHCIIPADAIYEPDWRSGKALATRIERADGEPLGIAGLWSQWTSPQGQTIHSYTMLTINADDHPFMRLFHKPGDEKRMLVILPPECYQGWLHATPAHSMAFLQPVPAEALRAHAGGSEPASEQGTLRF
ncbi:MAG: SOS response-associated peptidase [Candidatus Competibacter sp.]